MVQKYEYQIIPRGVCNSIDIPRHYIQILQASCKDICVISGIQVLTKIYIYIYRRGPAQDIPFFTRHLILVNHKVVSPIYQLIFLSFSYLNRARHNSVFALCRELQNELKHF